MKAKKFLALTCLSTTLIAGVTACKPGVVVGGESTIQIRAFNGGYGTAWLHEIAENFEKVFPQYKVQFVEESSLVSQTAGNEMQTPNKNQIDLYFTTGSDVSNLINKSKSILKTSKSTLMEPLNDVFESKAIGYDGKEEAKTIKERMFDGYEESMTYNGIVEKWHGNMYSLPWADGATGLFYNPEVLAKYGIAEPLTSNELTAAVQEIASHSKADKIYPWSWAGSNAVGYWLYLYETWFAQYSGKTGFNNFLKCDPGDGDIEMNGYKVYQDQGIYEALKAMYNIIDLSYASNGSIQKTHMEAQNEFMRAKSAFLCDGEWLYREMSGDYEKEASKIKMLAVPVLSKIGEENGLTDAQLHDVVAAIDAGQTDDAIKQAIPTASAAAIAKVRDARSIHDAIGVGHCMEVPSSSDCKEAVKTFIRFIYSEDGCRSFRKLAKGNLPLEFEIKDEGETTDFQKSVDKILRTGKPQMVSADSKLNDVRSLSQMYLFNSSAWVHPTTFAAVMQHKADLTPEKIFNDEKAYMQDSWSKYMSYVF